MITYKDTPTQSCLSLERPQAEADGGVHDRFLYCDQSKITATHSIKITVLLGGGNDSHPGSVAAWLAVPAKQEKCMALNIDQQVSGLQKTGNILGVRLRKIKSAGHIKKVLLTEGMTGKWCNLPSVRTF